MENFDYYSQNKNLVNKLVSSEIGLSPPEEKVQKIDYISAGKKDVRMKLIEMLKPQTGWFKKSDDFYTVACSRYTEMRQSEEPGHLKEMSARATSSFYQFVLDRAAVKWEELNDQYMDAQMSYWKSREEVESLEKQVQELSSATQAVLEQYQKHLDERKKEKIFFPSQDPFLTKDYDYASGLSQSDRLDKLKIYHHLLHELDEQIKKKTSEITPSTGEKKTFVHERARIELNYLQAAFASGLEDYRILLNESLKDYQTLNEELITEDFIPRSVKEVQLSREKSKLLFLEKEDPYYGGYTTGQFEDVVVIFGAEEVVPFKGLRKDYITLLIKTQTYEETPKSPVGLWKVEIDYLQNMLSHKLANYCLALQEHYTKENPTKEFLRWINEEIQFRDQLLKNQNYLPIGEFLMKEKEVLEDCYHKMSKQFAGQNNAIEIFTNVINKYRSFLQTEIEKKEVDTLTIQESEQWLAKIPEAIEKKREEQQKADPETQKFIEIEILGLGELFSQVLKKYEHYLQQREVPEKFRSFLIHSEKEIKDYGDIVINQPLATGKDAVALSRDLYADFHDAFQKRHLEYVNKLNQPLSDVEALKMQIEKKELTYLENEVKYRYHEYETALKSKYMPEDAKLEHYDTLCSDINKMKLVHSQDGLIENEIKFLENMREELSRKIQTNNHKNPERLLTDSSMSAWFMKMFGYEDPFAKELKKLEDQGEKALVAKYNYLLSQIIHVLRNKVIERNKEIDGPRAELLNSEIRALQAFFDQNLALYKSCKPSESMLEFIKSKALETFTFGYYQGGYKNPELFSREKKYADSGYDMVDRLKNWFIKKSDISDISLKNVSEKEAVFSAIYENLEISIFQDTKNKKMLPTFMRWAQKHPHSAARMVSDLKTMWGIINNKSEVEIVQERIKDIHLLVELLKQNPEIETIDDEPVEMGDELDFRMLADLCHVLPKIYAGVKAALSEAKQPSSFPLVEGVVAIVKTYVPAISIFEAALQQFPQFQQTARIFGAVLYEVTKVSAIQSVEKLSPDLTYAYAVASYIKSQDFAVVISESLKLQRDTILARQAGNVANLMVDWMEGKSVADTIKNWWRVFKEAPASKKAKMIFFNVASPILLTAFSTHTAFIIASTLPIDIALVAVGVAVTGSILIGKWLFDRVSKDKDIEQVRAEVQKNEFKKKLKEQTKTKDFQEIIENQASAVIVSTCEHFNRVVSREQIPEEEMELISQEKRNQWIEEIKKLLDTEIQENDSDEICIQKFLDKVKNELDSKKITFELKEQIFGTLAQQWLLPNLKKRYTDTFTTEFQKFGNKDVAVVLQEKGMTDAQLYEQIAGKMRKRIVNEHGKEIGEMMDHLDHQRLASHLQLPI